MLIRLRRQPSCKLLLVGEDKLGTGGEKVPPARFELTAPGLGILCSILLSYGGTSTKSSL